jgi:tRNA dimethylallyltransferase
MNNAPITSPVLILVGPTAIGKTALSLEIALAFGCEIISMDSMQVYRHMDIGTAKASAEDRGRVPHHLLDIRDPDDQYDAAQFVRDAYQAARDIVTRGRIPLITGGTGLYLASLLNGLFEQVAVTSAVRAQVQLRLEKEGREHLYQELLKVDRESGARIHPHDTQRLMRALEIFHATGLPWSEHLRSQARTSSPALLTRVLQLSLTCDRATLYGRIEKRTCEMMREAFQQEVQWLLDQGYGQDLASMRSLGYRHMAGVLRRSWNLETARDELIRDTRRYAKRQMTWFRKHRDLQWFGLGQENKVFAAIERFLGGDGERNKVNLPREGAQPMTSSVSDQ